MVNWNFFLNEEKDKSLYTKAYLVSDDNMLEFKNGLETINTAAISNPLYSDCIFFYIGGGGFVT